MVCGKREFELLNKINFIRTCGTEEEKQAAQILAEEARAIGTEPVIESFDVDRWDIKKVSLVACGKEWEVTGYGMSGSTPEEGITAPFAYIQDATDVDLLNTKGKIVMVNGRVGDELYKKLVKAGVAAFITFEGNIVDKREETDLDTRNLRDWAIKEGKIPGVNMRTMDAHELVKAKPETVTLTLIQDEGLATSQNVIAEIKGSDPEAGTIVFGAHYDSVPFSHGVYDNGAGSVIIMELMRYFKENQPKRSIKFCWYGSEERGLLGSKAYCANHEDKLGAIELCVNIDMIGCTMGRFIACCTSEDKLVSYISYMGREVGFQVAPYQDVYSSDSTPFSDKGIPAVSFARSAPGNTAVIHNSYDTVKSMKTSHMIADIDFITAFTARMANAAFPPVAREMPDNMKDKLDRYLCRKR